MAQAGREEGGCGPMKGMLTGVAAGTAAAMAPPAGYMGLHGLLSLGCSQGSTAC